jgi:hypothetical protein
MEYHVDFLTSEGSGVGEKLVVRPESGEWEIALPESALSVARDYLVVRIIARRHQRRAPRAFAIHLRQDGDNMLKLVGLRH